MEDFQKIKIKMLTKTVLYSCLFGSLIGILIGCTASSIKESALRLKQTQQAIVLSARTADQLCTDGVLNQVQCNKAEKLYLKSQEYYTEALETELLYISNAEEYKDERNLARKNLFDTANRLGELIYGY